MLNDVNFAACEAGAARYIENSSALQTLSEIENSEPTRYKIELTENFQPSENEEFGGADRILIPFNSTELNCLNHNAPMDIRLVTGQALYIPADLEDFSFIRAHGSEFLILEIPAELKNDLKILADSEIEALSKLRVIYNATNCLSVAKMAKRILLSSNISNPQVKESLCTVILSEVILAAKCSVVKKNRLSHKDMDKVRTYISTNIDQDLSLEKLSQICNMPTHCFTRIFKSLTGSTPYQFVLEQRLNVARKLLRSSEDTIAAIAYATGFSSQSHMTDMFNRRIGITPAKYRKQNFGAAK